MHWPEHIPLWGRRVVRPSGRAFVSQGNQQRLVAFKALHAALSNPGLTERLLFKLGLAKQGPSSLSKEELEIMGHFVNAASWRGDVGKFVQTAVAAANIFWSPRGYVGHFQHLAGSALWAKHTGRGTWRVRRLIAREYALTLAGKYVFYFLISNFMQQMLGDPGDDEETGWSFTLDPFHPDGGKLRIGRRRIDMTGGLGSTARTGIRLSANMINTIRKMGGGELTKEQLKEMDASLSIAGRYLVSKGGPFVSTERSLTTGKTYEGDEITLGKLVTQNTVSLTFGDIYESFKELGFSGGTAASILAWYGFGGMTYKTKKKPIRRSTPASRRRSTQ